MKNSVSRGVLWILIAICLNATGASAETLYVGAGQEFTGIQEGIEAAWPGDTIIVSAGLYEENINFLGKNITLTSTNPDDPAIVENTVIDGGGTGSTVLFINGEGPEAVLTGFTITGGYGTVNARIGEEIYWGGGIYCENASPTITRNLIQGNLAPMMIQDEGGTIIAVGYGGAIACFQSDALINRNVITQNESYAAGGVFVYYGQTIVTNNIIVDNSASVGGGVVLLVGGNLIHNTVLNNTAEAAGNVYAMSEENNQNRVINNIIVNATSGGGVYSDGEFTSLLHNNVWGNTGGNYISLSDQTGLNGNISNDPLFEDVAGGDLHLLPGSPCIDTGTNSVFYESLIYDYDGQIRPVDGDFDGDPISDIGAYEAEGSTSPVIFASARKFSFAAMEEGDNPDEKILVIRNGGREVMNWSIEESCDWLEIAPLAGSSAGGADQTEVHVSVNIDGMSSGSYTCTFEIISQEAVNSPKSVTVNLFISAEGELLVPDMYETIQSAIDAALPGNTVIVSPGTYYDNLDFSGKNITLTSIDPADSDIVNSTIVLGLGNGPVVTFNGTEDETCVLEGFTIAGGYNATGFGGGICGNDAGATIRRCVFRNNIAASYPGGGIWGIAGTISHCIFQNNHGTVGGGLAKCNGVISDCLITNNTADEHGAALHNCDGTIVNCTLVNDQQSALSLINISDGVIENCIMHSLSGTTFHYSTAQTRYCCYPAATGEGSIDADPLFVDAAAGDYHLSPGSQCINAGDPGYIAFEGQADLDGKARIIGSAVDIGAYEFEGVYAGPDQSFVEIPDVITLQGEYISNLASPVTFQWQQISGPEVSLVNGDTLTAAFIPTVNGIYIFELTASDDFDNSNSDQVGVLVGNTAPRLVLPEMHYISDAYNKINTSGIYDPDGFGRLIITFDQISGPYPLIISNDGYVSGFTSTDNKQEFEFNVSVSDGQLSSETKRIKVVITPDVYSRENVWGYDNKLVLENGSFDPSRPTIVYLGGGNGNDGSGSPLGYPWSQNANVLYFEDYANNFCCHTGPNYKSCAAMLISYLSNVAPDYNELIQMAGFSTGTTACLDVAKQVNRDYVNYYDDFRYAVNRVSTLDVATSYSGQAQDLLDELIDNKPENGEPCWVDNYRSGGVYLSGALNINFPGGSHGDPPNWYLSASYDLTNPNWDGTVADLYNDGITAGWYISVCGPMANLVFSGSDAFYFKWTGNYDWSSPVVGHLEQYSNSYSGKLPQPITLDGPNDEAIVGPEGARLSCLKSKHAVRYQLLFGPDPDNVKYPVSLTANPPSQVITQFPFEKTYWTIKAFDQYGNSIHADPMCIRPKAVHKPVENINLGKRYPYIQLAIDEAADGEEIVVDPGVCPGSINLKGKNLILRSSDPTNATMTARTIIQGAGTGAIVTFSGTEDETCVLEGFTIAGGYNATGFGGGICGNESEATIRHCVFRNNIATTYPGGGIWGIAGTISNCIFQNNHGTAGGGLAKCNGVISNCLITNNTTDTHGAALHNCDGTIVNCTIVNDQSSALSLINISDGVIENCIMHSASGSIFNSSTAQTRYCCYPAATGEGSIDADPLFVDPANDNYHLSSGSPCIDSGDPAYVPQENETDIDGWLRIVGSGIDIGAFEYDGQHACISLMPKTMHLYVSDDTSLIDSGQLQIANTQASPLHWEINEDCPWLTISPSNGELVEGIDEVLISVDANGLPEGVYTYTADVISGDAVNSHQPLEIVLHVNHTVLYVPSEYRFIQHAIEMAQDSETVIVSPGAYNENLEFGGKNITLTSIDPADSDIVNSTIILGLGNGSVVTFNGTEDETCVLEGFTITGGYTTGFGGGICGNDAVATIHHCVFRDNIATSYPGGGIWGLSGTISNCIFQNNHGIVGGGLAKCNGVISDCLITNNTADEHGAALHNCDGTIVHCTIVNDQSSALSLINISDGVIENCIMRSLSGTTFNHSTAQTRYCCYPAAVGEGSIDADPLFVDAAAGDYHLQPDSLCIDAGTDVGVYDDLEGNLRPFNVLGVDNNGGLDEFDIGAYEVTFPMVEVPMKLTPHMLNCRKTGKWVKAHIVLPEGFNLEDVDMDTAACLEPFGAESVSVNPFINEEDLVEVEITFARTDLCSALTDSGEVGISVTGALTTGQYVYGTDTINLNVDILRQLSVFMSQWLQIGSGLQSDLDDNGRVDLKDFSIFANG